MNEFKLIDALIIDRGGKVLAQVNGAEAAKQWINEHPEYELEDRSYLCDGQCYHYYVKARF